MFRLDCDCHGCRNACGASAEASRCSTTRASRQRRLGPRRGPCEARRGDCGVTWPGELLGRSLRVCWGATDQTLFCESMYGGRERTFDRAGVRGCAPERQTQKLPHRAFGLVRRWQGFIWGVAVPPGVNGAPRWVSGLAGAVAGGVAGLVVSIPATLLIPGRLVYRHGRSGSAARRARRNR